MSCREVRRELRRRPASRSGAIAAHLADCAACARLAARLERVRRDLAAHHAGIEPDPGFAARVVARLPRPAEMLGWAALRLLPVTLALVLVLTGWCWLSAPAPSALLEESPSDDLLSWVLDDAEEAR